MDPPQNVWQIARTFRQTYVASSYRRVPNTKSFEGKEPSDLWSWQHRRSPFLWGCPVVSCTVTLSSFAQAKQLLMMQCWLSCELWCLWCAMTRTRNSWKALALILPSESKAKARCEYVGHACLRYSSYRYAWNSHHLFCQWGPSHNATVLRHVLEYMTTR